MKRIAVLFFGQPRQLKKAAEFTKPFFDLSEAEIETDYFFHSWTMVDPKKENKTYKVGDKSQILLSECQILDDIHGIYSPVQVEIEDALSDEFTTCAQKFVDLYNSFDDTKFFTKKDQPYSFWMHNSLAKYKIGQLYSSQKVVKNRIKYENKNSIKYDAVFRIRTDMAFRPYEIDERLKYLKYGLGHYKQQGPHCASGREKNVDDKIIFTNFLHTLYGLPLCGDQKIWGKPESIDNIFTDCINVYLNYLEDWLSKCSSGYFEEINFGKNELFHIEIAIPYLASKKFCSIHPLHGADFCLVRDTVEPNDDYQEILDKAGKFY
jgi:hypothetical protein